MYRHKGALKILNFTGKKCNFNKATGVPKFIEACWPVTVMQIIMSCWCDVKRFECYLCSGRSRRNVNSLFSRRSLVEEKPPTPSSPSPVSKNRHCFANLRGIISSDNDSS